MFNYKLLAFSTLILTFFSLSIPALAAVDIYKVSDYAPNGGIKVYAQPKINSSLVVTIPSNSSWVKKIGLQQGNWQRIAWNGQIGWIKEINSIALDRAASSITFEKKDCEHDPDVTNKMCCGIVETTKDPNKVVKIYSVTGLPKGDLLTINEKPRRGGRIVLRAPHNATWLMKLDKKQRKDGVSWEKVQWGGREGWIDGSKIQYSPELTAVNDAKRKECNKDEGCAPDLSALKDKK